MKAKKQIHVQIQKERKEEVMMVNYTASPHEKNSRISGGAGLVIAHPRALVLVFAICIYKTML